MSERTCFTSYAKGSPRKVDRAKGVIYDAKIIEVGEAKGHGLYVDEEFLDSVAKSGSSLNQGLKARFGHPNLCSNALGTFLGRWKGLYRDGNEVRGNLFLSNTAKDAPGGDLFEYVLSMAENDPDMFGVSISFDRDSEAEKLAGMHEDTNLQICRLKKLHAGDCVDDPAATSGGLFSAFTKNSIAGQITEFLDQHPDVWDAFEQNPDILKALSKHGEKMDEFTTRYRQYRKQDGGIDMSKEQKEIEAAAEAEALAAKEAEANLKAKAEKEAAELAAKEKADKEAAELAANRKTEGEDEGLSREEFGRIVEEFGAEIAAKVVLDGGGYVEALIASHKALKAENELLKEGTPGSTGGTPAKVVAANSKKYMFKIG